MPVRTSRLAPPFSAREANRGLPLIPSVQGPSRLRVRHVPHQSTAFASVSTAFSPPTGVDLTIGNDEPTGKLIRQLLGAVSEWEKCALVQKLRASRLRMRRAGERCEGAKPYGHTPEEQQIVEKILSFRREKKSYVTIAEQLNNDGVRPRTGQKWHPTQVQRVIQRAEPK